MKDLHWLSIAHRIKFKLFCILMHGAIFGQSPSYIRDLLVPVSEMQGRTRLRSAAAGLRHSFHPNTVRSSCFLGGFPFGTVLQSISDRFLTLDNLKER